MSRLGCSVLLAGWLLVEAGPGLHAAPAPAAARPRLIPGGVTDPTGKVAFVSGPTGKLEAVSLASGKVLWSGADVAHPLLATDTRLFAWAAVPGKLNEITVLVLDPARGKRILQSRPLTFPSWVSTGVSYGRSFDCTAQLREDSLFFVWQARAWYAGGAAPPPQIEEAARKSANGVVRIAVESGRPEVLDRNRVPAGLPREIPAAPNESKAGDYTLRTLEKTVAGGGPPPQRRKRLLQALDRMGKLAWEHEIQPPPYLPPLP
jgi:hypothetical protein